MKNTCLHGIGVVKIDCTDNICIIHSYRCGIFGFQEPPQPDEDSLTLLKNSICQCKYRQFLVLTAGQIALSDTVNCSKSSTEPWLFESVAWKLCRRRYFIFSNKMQNVSVVQFHRKMMSAVVFYSLFREIKMADVYSLRVIGSNLTIGGYLCEETDSLLC